LELFCGRLTGGAEMGTLEAGEGSRLNESREGFFVVGKDALTRSMSEGVDLWMLAVETEYCLSFFLLFLQTHCNPRIKPFLVI